MAERLALLSATLLVVTVVTPPSARGTGEDG